MSCRGRGRHFAVAVFVVQDGKVLLHWHRKLGMWLPPGGHIEPDELPDEAAARAGLEETGVEVELAGARRGGGEAPAHRRPRRRAAGAGRPGAGGGGRAGGGGAGASGGEGGGAGGRRGGTGSSAADRPGC